MWTIAWLLALLAPATIVHGTVRAEGSREPVAQAVVEVMELGSRTVTDAHGYFAIAGVPPGNWRVRVNALGYAEVEQEFEVPAEGSVRIDLTLAPKPIELAGLEVLGGGNPSAGTVGAGPRPLRVSSSVIGLTPGLAEADVLRVVQTLPAVAAASDFSSALYVRGGSPDQNLILLDGMPLFNPYHLGGIFAAIDPDAVASVELIPGAFPARVGDRLSSAIGVTTRDGGRDRVRASGALGLISSRAGVEGPLPGGGGSFLLSGRRTYLDLATRAATSIGVLEHEIPYAFTDLHLKLTHDVGELGKISASGYMDTEGLRGDDDEGILGGSDWSWGTRAGSLRLRHPLIAGLLGEVQLAAGVFRGHLDSEDHEAAGSYPTRPLYLRTTMRDILVAGHLTWSLPAHQLRAGLQLDRYLFEHNIRSGTGTVADYFPDLQRTDRLGTIAVYLEDEWKPVEALQIRVGGRFLDAGEVGAVWLPRIGGRLHLSPALAFTFGSGRSAQAVRSLRYEESIVASLVAYDLLVAADPGTGLSLADDVTIGAEWTAETTSLRLDAYTKWYRNLPLVPLPVEPLQAPVIAQEFQPGAGRARGMEVQLRRAFGRATISGAYALSFAEYRLGDDVFAPRFHRQHSLDLMGMTTLGERGHLSARLALGSGQPYTPPVGALQTLRFDPRTGGYAWPVRGEPILLGRHNSARLPGYLRLDLALRTSAERSWFGKRVTVTPYLQILNVLNTRNVLSAAPDMNGTERRLEYAPQIPFLPSFGVEWRF